MKKYTNSYFRKSLFLISTSIFFLLPAVSFCQVQIDGTTTIVSSCSNNGSITVTAHTTKLPMLYSIIAGPQGAAPQTNNILSSLPAGTYTVKVTDGAGTSATKSNVVVAGNYLPVNFTPITKDPACSGNSNGQIIGNRTTATGKAPFSWEIVSPSPVTRPPQANDTFNNLRAGNYSIKVTDNCGSIRTFVATLNDPANATLAFLGDPSIEIGCTGGIASIRMRASSLKFPLTYTFQTNSGTTTTTTPTSFNLFNHVGDGGDFDVTQKLSEPFAYGDYLKVTVTDNCGQSVSSKTFYSRTFGFCPVYSDIFQNCTFMRRLSLGINSYDCFPNSMQTYISPAIKYVVTDVLTNEIVDSATTTKTVTGVTLKFLPPNRKYKITIDDTCGHHFENSYTIVPPAVLAPKITYKSLNKIACIDSVATLSVSTDNFKGEPTLIMLSGPSSLGSTKPGYEYQGSYAYPKSFKFTGWGGGVNAVYIFDITNLAAGKYYFKVIDTCGSEIQDSITIKTTDVADLNNVFSYKKGCLGKNQINYFINAKDGTMEITPYGTGNTTYKYYSNYPKSTITDSLVNLPSGKYTVSFRYSGYAGALPANATNIACKVITDYVTIQGYETPVLLAGNYVRCKESVNNIVLTADSSKGVTPYTYEIISGPQTFPVQNSNIFPVSTPGIYQVRISDVCANASTVQITIDTMTFPPPTRLAAGCSDSKVFYGSSIYYNYQWTKPNGSIYNGDTLTVNPITTADTGNYIVRKIINLNNCKDTFYTTYHLALHPSSHQIFPFCSNINTIVQVGTSTYTKPGEYTDTLKSVNGCDSIVTTSIVDIQKKDTNNVTICKGNNITVGSNTYSNTGLYKDSVINAQGCYDFIFTNLTVKPDIKDSLVKSICAGQNYTVGPHTYTTTGIYYDTLSTAASCDSIVILNLTVKTDCASSRLCSGATHVVWKDDFGSGTPLSHGPDSNIPLSYSYIGDGIGSGRYYITNHFNNFYSWHIIPEDHTPNDTNGYFLIIDGQAPVFYATQINNLCPNTDYTFSAWAMNTDLPSFDSHPSFIFRVTDTADNMVGELTTPKIFVQTTPLWVNNGFTFNSGNNTKLKLSLLFIASDPYNDFAFDDLALSVCGPTLALTSTSSSCTNKVNVNAVLGSGYANPVYQWYKQDAAGVWAIITNANTTTYTDNDPSATNWYKLTVSNGASSCAFIEDSIQVTLSKPPLVPVIVDTSICVGQSVFGHMTPGQYIDTLKSSAGCDSIKRTLNLLINPLKRDTINVSICQGLQYPFGSKTYGSSGIYRDTLSTLTCDSIVVLNLTVTPASAIKIITNSTKVDKGSSIQLNTISSAPYLWISTATISNKNIQDPTAIINDPSWIYLYATSNCPSVDSVFISVRGDSIIISPPPCNDSYIRMPNAFTPNHDGQNDVFKPIAKNIRLESFQVYDRWGQMVFQTSDMNAGWDGNYQGQQMPIGNYVYWLSYYDCNHVSIPELIKGNIILIR
jgi:gliding motility-associated-like protein